MCLIKKQPARADLWLYPILPGAAPKMLSFIVMLHWQADQYETKVVFKQRMIIDF